MKIRHYEPYVPLRARSYPSVGEQLDAIFKMALALQKQGLRLPDETQNWITQCQTVKDRYAKKEKLQ